MPDDMPPSKSRGPIQPYDDSWREYRRLVIAELERLNQSIDRIADELGKVKTEVALLQLKASIWGSLAGAVVALGVILTRYIGG